MKIIISNLTLIMLVLVFAIGCGNSEPDYKLQKFDVRLDNPHQINVLLQVNEADGSGVTDLKIEDLIIIEDNNIIGSEAEAKLVPSRNVNISVKTFLLIDNSKSMDDKLDELKSAAKALIDQSPNYQSFALYVFSSNLEQIIPLTKNKDMLKKAIDLIGIGTSSTNLYGSLRDLGNIVRRYPEKKTLSQIDVTNMICFSDGDDTRGTVDASEATKALKDLNVFLIGTGQDLKTGVLNNLGEFYPLESIKQLKKIFLGILKKIDDQANSYYWLLYQSPKRGDKVRILTISLEDEVETSVQLKFNSKDFTDY